MYQPGPHAKRKRDQGKAHTVVLSPRSRLVLMDRPGLYKHWERMKHDQLRLEVACGVINDGLIASKMVRFWITPLESEPDAAT